MACTSSYVARISSFAGTLHASRFTGVENAAGGLFQHPASLIGFLLVILMQSRDIPISDASTVPPNAIDPTPLHTLKVRYKTLAKQLACVAPGVPVASVRG